MPPSSIRTTDLTPENIAKALLKGGFSLVETIIVIERIQFDTSKWDGKKIIEPKIN